MTPWPLVGYLTIWWLAVTALYTSIGHNSQAHQLPKRTTAHKTITYMVIVPPALQLISFTTQCKWWVSCSHHVFCGVAVLHVQYSQYAVTTIILWKVMKMQKQLGHYLNPQEQWHSLYLEYNLPEHNKHTHTRSRKYQKNFLYIVSIAKFTNTKRGLED